MNALSDGARAFLVASLVVASAACASADPAVDAPIDVAATSTARATRAPDDTTDPRRPAVVAPTPGAPTWSTDLDVAVARAEAEHRPMLIDFNASWCVPCRELKTKTFLDPEFLAEAGRFILVDVDVTQDDDPKVLALLAKWKVDSVPMLILRDESGAEVERIRDFIAANALAPKLHGVK